MLRILSNILKKDPRKIYNWLLNYDEVIDWITKYRSKKTQKEYLLGLNKFCNTVKVDIEMLFENTPEENEELIKEAERELSKNLKVNTVLGIIAPINSFLRFYKKKLEKAPGENHDTYGRFRKKSESEKVYGWLLDYSSIRLWIDGYTNESTRKGYLSVMHHFCKRAGITPDKLLEMSQKEIRLIYRKIKNQYNEERKTASAKRLYATLKLFFAENEIEVNFKRRDKVRVVQKKLNVQHIPSKDEIYRIADSSGSIRNRALILFLFQSGVRVNVIQNLTYGMVKDQLYPELKVPIRLKITPEIDSKLSLFGLGYYYAFLQDEAVESLKAYIDWRKEAKGWLPKDDDPIFVAKDYYLNLREGKTGIKQNNCLLIVKRAVKNAGLDSDRIWTHLIRKSFRKVLYQAPIDNDLAEAIMGHKVAGSKENYFDRHDLNWIAFEYMKAPFSREGVGRLNQLEKEKQKLEAQITTQQEEIKTLKDDFNEMKEILQDLLKKQDS